MSNTLSVHLLQLPIKWHDPKTNFESANEQVQAMEKCDLIVLPEMWSSGFTMFAHKFHQYTQEAIDLMKAWSQLHDACIVGSLITKVEENYYNRLYIVEDGKVAATYDKKHLFAFSGEDRYFQGGEQRLIYTYKEWRLCLNVCYDLRFPVWCRNTDDYDILLFSANWPDKRIAAWNTLLRARAIENQCYVIGVNCYGEDTWHNTYAGHSALISYDGSDIMTLEGKGGVISSEILKSDLSHFRKALPFLKDRDSFQLD